MEEQADNNFLWYIIVKHCLCFNSEKNSVFSFIINPNILLLINVKHQTRLFEKQMPEIIYIYKPQNV